MKNILHLISLLAVGGYAAAQFAGAGGYHVADAINASNLVSVLTFAGIALLLLADYRQPRRASLADRRADIANTTSVVTAPRRRSAYSIRRGAEAARLASPTAVIRFPAAPRVRCDRAA
jgi:hypothetical protein